MRNKLAFKIALIAFSLIGAGFAAALLFGTNPLARAKPEDRNLAQLLDDMGVEKIPPSAVPVEIRLQDLNGTSVELSGFKGKIVFLNFWATWCPSCVVEMPSMEKLHRKLNSEDFAMVTISIQDSAADVKRFFNHNQLTFTALLDSFGNSVPAFGIRAIPTTYILDKNGRIIGRAMGAREWDSRESLAMFKRLADESLAIQHR